MQKLYKMNACIIIFTEGHKNRCNSLTESYGLKKFIKKAIENRKESAIYRKIKEDYNTNHSFMIGDQIDRDILPAKEVGFITIYFPGGFQPKWNQHGSYKPDYTISSFSEIPTIISSYNS